jgi:hypothetical protein
MQFILQRVNFAAKGDEDLSSSMYTSLDKNISDIEGMKSEMTCDGKQLFKNRGAIISDFPETVPVLWILKSSVLLPGVIRSGTPNVPVFPSHKNTYGHLDFPIGGRKHL